MADSTLISEVKRRIDEAEIASDIKTLEELKDYLDRATISVTCRLMHERDTSDVGRQA